MFLFHIVFLPYYSKNSTPPATKNPTLHYTVILTQTRSKHPTQSATTMTAPYSQKTHPAIPPRLPGNAVPGGLLDGPACKIPVPGPFPLKLWQQSSPHRPAGTRGGKKKPQLGFFNSKLVLCLTKHHLQEEKILH